GRWLWMAVTPGVWMPRPRPRRHRGPTDAASGGSGRGAAHFSRDPYCVGAKFFDQWTLGIIPAGEIERWLQGSCQFGLDLDPRHFRGDDADEQVGAHPARQDDFTLVSEHEIFRRFC